MVKKSDTPKEPDSFARLLAAAEPFKQGYILSIITVALGVICRVLPFVFIPASNEPNQFRFT